MRHYYLTNEGRPPSGDHYSVGTNGQGRVLVQLGEDRPEHLSGHGQIRLALTPDQAEHLAQKLLDSAHESRKQVNTPLFESAEPE